MDKKNAIKVIKILYNKKYPRKPPIVHSTPRIEDPCFDSKGYLHFAVIDDIFGWNLFRKHSNPLLYLIDELVKKYHLV